MIDLFEHNKVAYDSAVAMLAKCGKAAIVHPTGTGKSFVGFRLCEDHPDQIVCWLSPSEYIFKTQLENLSRMSGGWQPENIRFFTYAKLMLLSQAELVAISPDYIVLDEFHRCGAEQWGRGVEALLRLYPDVPVLGLSATNIRYLDNQRNMADELFDGNVASEMTLGEAIARGILATPKYVLSVFSCHKDLDTYRSRVKRVKNKLIRNEAERYLESLRRTLEKADGLDVIFDKHMTDRTGKYIVFCANFSHMQEMIGKAGDWFGKVDPAPHIYTVYSDDPSASKSFQEFGQDSDKAHLKLLYCIDALNEGVHVDGISGVILLRPTVSPIIYKQQIGRALAAGTKNHPVIFDIVLNIENLYSINAIEQEIQVAMTYYRSLGKGDEIISEPFEVIGEVGDCMKLFEKLNDTLTVSWERMFGEAKRYYQQYGNLEVPYSYKTPDGYSLGHWILTQKRIRTGEQFGTLTADRIALLDGIGMVWGRYRDLSWERNLAAARTYSETHGDLNVPAAYKTPDGIRLGAWLAQLRTWRKNQIRQSYLTAERIAALDAIGMIWNVTGFLWQRNFFACMMYYHSRGNLDVPLNYVTADGIRLGLWLNNIRNAYKGVNPAYRLTEEQIFALNGIGMLWDRKNDRLWEKGYHAAVEYRREYGDLNVPAGYKTMDGYRLGAWICNQREREEMPERRRRLLDALGMIWVKPDSWETRYLLAKNYYEKTGNLNIPSNYKPDGIWLAKWVNEQRQIYLGNRGEKRLTNEQIARLNEIGMSWENRKETEKRLVWESRYAEAKQFYDAHGNLSVPMDYVGTDGKNLSVWIQIQRKYYQNGKLTKKQVEQLSAIGMVWNPADKFLSPAFASTAFSKNPENLHSVRSATK